MIRITGRVSFRVTVPDGTGADTLVVENGEGETLRVTLVDRAQDLEYSADLAPAAVLAAVAKAAAALGVEVVPIVTEAAG